MQIVWLPTALDKLTEIRRHIGNDNPLAAQRMAKRILAAGNALEMFPERGRPTGVPDVRELVIAGTSYLLVYRVVGKTVQILRVWHEAQLRD